MKVKDLAVEQWIRITFFGSPIVNGKVDWHTREYLWSFAFPRDQKIDRYAHRIQWIRGRFIYLNPKLYLRQGQSHYDKKTGADWGTQSLLGKISARKGQITKWKNKIEKYKKDFVPNLMNATWESTEAYQNAMKKLKKKEFELKAVEDEFIEKYGDIPTKTRKARQKLMK